MSKIYKGTTGLIGNTPLVEAVNIEKSQKLNATERCGNTSAAYEAAQ